METFTKEEIHQAIEKDICAWCKNYQEGHFGCLCAICKVSEVFSIVDALGEESK